MIPVSLQLSNFMSYGEQSAPVDFTGFHLACLSGPNGHGKSALLDAVTWALWGQARKGSGGGKPDSGLIRIGQSRMFVDYVFDLAGLRYRVIRTYEQRPSGSDKRDLQFQLQDDKDGGYKDLTRKNLSDTQQLIVDTLRMDYDTFITSSFLLQGRADEFTRRRPQERKAVLAEILNLDRYERLRELAREKLKQLDDALKVSGTRKQDIDRQLERREELETAQATHLEEYKKIESQSASLEKRFNELSRLIEESHRMKVQIQEGQKRQSMLRSQIEESMEQSQRLSGQLESLKKVVAQKPSLEKQRGEYLEAGKRLEALSQALEERSRLEKLQGEIQRRIDREESGIKEMRVRLQSELESTRQGIREADKLVARREEIENAAEEYEKVRSEIGRMEKLQERQSQLEKKLGEIHNLIEQQHLRLQSEKEQLQNSLQTLQDRLKKRPELLKQQKELLKKKERLQQLTQQRETLTEQGQAARNRQNSLENEKSALEKNLKQDEEKISLLQSTRQAQCPLCQSELDEKHRGELLNRLTGEQEQAAKRLDDLQKKWKESSREVDSLLNQYKECEKELKSLETVPEALGRIEAELNEMTQCGKQVEELQPRFHRIIECLENKAFAESERRQYNEIQKELSSLGFSPEELSRQRMLLEKLGKSASEKPRLDDALDQQRRLSAREQDLDEQLGRVAAKLASQDFALEARAELKHIEEQLAAMDYDPREHKRLKQRWNELGDIPDQWSRLLHAEEQLPSVEEQLSEKEKDLESKRNLHKQLEQEIKEIEAGLPPEGMEKEHEETKKNLQSLTRKKEELAGEIKSCEREQQRLDALEKERKDLDTKAVQLRQNRRHYDILAEAFSARGVQALIIENAIPLVEEEANRILSRLTGNRTQVALESLREKKSGGAVETLDIRISDELGSRDYELYSGGEAFRTDLALRISLSRLLALRAGTSLQTLVIDEGFGTQDTEGLENIVQVIRDISSEFEKILVVTHLESLKDAFPVRIEVTKHPDKGSVLEVIHN